MRDSLPARSPAATGGKTASMDPAFITLRNVDKFFGGFQALDHVSLDIGLGQKIDLRTVRPGKSTLIRCINRLETHDRGDIAIDGVRLDDGAAAALCCATMSAWFSSSSICSRICRSSTIDPWPGARTWP